MAYPLPSFASVRRHLLAAWAGRFTSAALSPHHHNFKLASIFALAATELHYHIQQVGLDLLPDTASDITGASMLRRHARIYGVQPRGAAGATGTKALRVYGEFDAAIPVNEPLTHAASGLRFETRSGGAVPAAGYLDVDVVALSTGTQTQLAEGEELAFDATPAGLETNARLVAALVEGRDVEQTDSLRDRLLNRIAEPAMGGNRNDYRQWVLEAAAYVETAYVYPNRNGLSTVDVAALKAGSGSTRALDASERAEVLDYVDERRPVSSRVRVLEVVAEEADVEALVLPESDPAYGFDWNDSTPPTVGAWVAGTRTLTFEADRPESMAAGDRLVVNSDGADGSEYVIESLSGADAVVLTEELVVAPSVGDPVYSGGPLVEPTRQAVLEHIDGLGPANPDAHRYGPWEGTLRLSALFEVVQTAAGVLDSDIAEPVANVEATDYEFPDNTRVGLLVPGKVLVRRWWT